MSFLSRLCADLDFVKSSFDTGLIARKSDSLMAETTPPPFAHLVAGLVAGGIDPNAARLGWQLWGKATQTLTLAGVDGALQFDGAQNISLVQNGEMHAFQNVMRNAAHVSARIGSKNLTALVVKQDRSVTVKIDGEQFDFEIIDPLDASQAQDDNADGIFAPMTGVVTIVNVAAGDTVTKGDPLLVLEAMKMEHVMVAPRDGVIAEVMCAPSSAVDEGSQLVVLEELAE